MKKLDLYTYLIGSKASSPSPGPWEEGPTRLIKDADGFTVCDTSISLASEEHLVGNIRLIAAAPDLLEALEFVDNFLQGFDDPRLLDSPMYSDVIKAIKKARGES